ncbi:uncharacterized protein LOC132163893 [Corylus avellana]|uniref:uncharacterized protein LOC132163893 n=1 Tax=Corylus avellana TaxID=13451 RepID=UPI00286A2465|nr:uncharacterized protein LOC132163893 [Corylus avellana]
MFVEKFENNDEEIQVSVCSGCDQSIYAPAYKCSDCNFFLHKSCAELSTEIQHPVHPSHTLVIQKPSESKFCYACRRDCDRCIFYHCNSCDFDIDIACASNLRSNTDDGHQHEFIPILQRIHFTCELCGDEDRNSVAQVCRICQLLAHTFCTRMPRTIKIMADRHLLTLIHLLAKVIKEHHDLPVCNLCYKRINLKYAGYYCQRCDFVAHLKCALKNSIGTIDDSSIEEEGIDFEEGEELEELKHFHHDQHNLFLSRNQVEVHHEHKLCEGCVKSISAPFYSCQQCNYFLHSKCARLPRKKRHPKHPHLLTLSARARVNYDVDGLIRCYACDRTSHGFGYMCHVCTYSIDIRCSSISRTFRHEVHQHPLFHDVISGKKCNACDRPDTPNYNDNGGVFVCTECNFVLGFECATLPLKAKYEYDPHPLLLTCVAKNDSEEYYCLICEKERNPNHWFYYCVECNFTAHPQCVVGSDPYIKYGRTFDHEWHQHPLTYARRTEDVSRPCDACGRTFMKNWGLNCTQCESFIHFNRACMFGYIENKITS